MSSLLRSLAVAVLSRYLGEYVEVDGRNLSVSLTAGDASLERVELRREALDALELPVAVRAGLVQRVRISIPWTALKSQPASIELSGLYLLAGPRADAAADAAAERRRAQSAKQRRLVLAEMFRPRPPDAAAEAAAAAAAAEGAGGDSFTSRLIALVLNNLQVTVSHVHMRYEDDLTTPERPFVCGLTLESFRGVTVDENGVPAFVVEPDGFIHKLVELRNFAFYWDSCGEHLEYADNEQLVEALDRLIWVQGQEETPPLNYLLMPVSGRLNLSILRDANVTDFSKPQHHLEFIFESIAVTLHTQQYKDFAALAEGFRLYQLRAPYAGLARPTDRPTKSAAAANQWWKYAVAAVMQDIREDKARWSWEKMLERKEDRQRYIVLYCGLRRELFKAADKDSEQAMELVALEEKLSYEDILMYRSLAEALMQREVQQRKRASASASSSASSVSAGTSLEAVSPASRASRSSQQQGYLGWMMGWSTGTSEDAQEELLAQAQGAAGVTITPQLMSELYEAVDLDAAGRRRPESELDANNSIDSPMRRSESSGTVVAALDVPASYVRRRVVFLLRSGSLKLYESGSEPFSTLEFRNLSCTLKSRSESHSFGAQLEAAEVFHGAVPIVSSRATGADNPLLTLKLGVNEAEKRGKHHDYSLDLSLRPLAILFSRPFTEALVHFFVRKRGTAWRDIQEFTGAGAQMEALQKQATNQLREVVDNKRSVSVSIFVDSPQIFVPEDVSKPKCAVLTVQMDSLQVSTLVRDRPEASALTANMVEKDPSIFYDRFTLDVSMLQLKLAQPESTWKWEEFESCRGSSAVLLDPSGISFALEKCLVDVPFLPAIKLSTTLPRATAYVSAKTFLSFVTCVRTVISDETLDAAVDASAVTPNAIVPFNEEEIMSLAEPQAAGQWMVDSEKKQKMQIAFHVQEAVILLHHEKTQRPLAEWRMYSFRITVADLPKETHFSIFLRSLELIDLHQPADAPSRFLMLSSDTEAGKDLIAMRFLSIHREAASFTGVDYEVDLQMQKMSCHCNRNTVASLIDLGNDILDGMAATAPEALALQKASLDVTGAHGLFLKVRFRMNALRIQFAREEDQGAFVLADIEKWDQSMRFYNNETWSLDIRVGTTVLRDLRPVARNWDRVLELSGDESLHFTFETMLPDMEERSLDCHPGHKTRGLNMKLTFRINNMRYVYVQNFVTEWIRYFMEIHSMQQMIAASYARAAGLAVNTVSEEQLLCYQVHLRNPLIIVPRNYESFGHAVLDLGTVSIANAYCVDAKGFHFVRTHYNLTKMNMHLHQWTAARAANDATQILADMTVSFAHEELEDISHAGPDFIESRWRVDCSTIKVVLSEDEAEWLFATVRENLVADAQNEATRDAYKDYQFIAPFVLADEPTSRNESMILDQNGNDDSDHHDEDDNKSNTSGDGVQQMLAHLLSSTVNAKSSAQPNANTNERDDPPLAVSPFVTREIVLCLEKIEVDLLEGDGNFGKATMVSFDIDSIDVVMSTDSSGYAISEYDLDSVNFLDKRHFVQNCFPKTLSSKNTGKQELHLTQVNYTNGDKDFMLTLAHPRIVLLPWAYRELWGFVWPLFERALESWDLWVNDGEVPTADTKTLQKEENGHDQDKGERPDWTFRVTVSDPEIVLVTNASQAASEALVLKGTVLFKHSEPGKGGQIRTVHFRELEAFRCFLTDPNELASESDTLVSMVEPTDLTLFHEWFPEKLREKWTVEMEPMRFTVSYHDFRMLSTLYRYWWPLEDEEEEEGEGVEKGRDAAPNNSPLQLPAKQKEEGSPHSRKSSSSRGSRDLHGEELDPILVAADALEDSEIERLNQLDREAEERKKAEQVSNQVRVSRAASASADAGESIQTVYKLSTHGTLLRLVNDFYVGNVPVALISLPVLSARLSQTADAMKVFLSTTFLAEVYNDVAQAWEPVIEPFTGEISYSHSDAIGTRASVTADSVLDLNLTEAAIDMLLRTWRDLSNDFYSRGPDSDGLASLQSETFRTLSAPYVVRNDTGASVWVWRTDEEGQVVEAPIHGYEVPLPEGKSRQFSHQTRYRNLDMRLDSSICVKVAGDLRVARDYPIHDVGCHLLRVDPEERIKLVLQISNQKGGKLLQVRTNIRFCNATNSPLELQGHSDRMGRIALTTLDPGAVYALPMAFLQRGRIRVRPVDKPYDWSAQSISVASIKPNSALMLCPPDETKAGGGHTRPDFALFCVMDPAEEDPGALLVPPEEEHAITFCAPVLFENLLGVTIHFRLSNAETEKVMMQGKLVKGEQTRVNLDVRQRLMLSVRLPDYHWSAPRGVLGPRAAYSIDILDRAKVPLKLDLHYVKYRSGLTKMSIFTQFWILNSTQVPLIHSQYSMNSRIVTAGQMSTVGAIQDCEMEWNDRSSTPPMSASSLSIQSQEGIALTDRKVGGRHAQPATTNSVMDFSSDLFRPLMYYPEKSGRKMSFRAAFTHWSDPFTVGEAGTMEVVDLPQAKRPRTKIRGAYQFVVSVERATGRFWRTRTVSIKPRIVLINHTKRSLLCSQQGVPVEDDLMHVQLAPDEQRPFHWVDARMERLLTVCFGEQSWNWSPGFPVIADHKMTIKARNLRGHSALLKVRIMDADGPLLVVFDEEHPEFPTYKIHNASSEPILIHQYLAVPHIYETVDAGATVAYAWDDPTIQPLLLEVLSSDSKEKILLDLDNMGLFNTSDPQHMLQLDPTEGLGHFYGVVTAEGPSKVATIKLNHSAQPFPHHIAHAEALRKERIAFHLSLRGIGVSLVNRGPLEVIYLSMSDIHLDFEDNKREQSFDFAIGHLQIDNQSFMTQFPVLLWTTPKKENFFTLSFVRSADYVSVHFIKRMSLFVDNMDVSMDDLVFLNVWDFVANVAKSFDIKSSMDADSIPEVLQKKLVHQKFTVPTHNLKKRQIYLQELSLSGTKLLVSFINTDAMADGKLGETAVSRIIRTYGGLVNIERAPVNLAPLHLSQQFLSRDELTDRLRDHYVTGVRRGLAKILASADFIGAPMALAGHVREGVRDLVELPKQGAASGGALGAMSGLGKGTASLAKSVGYGSFNSLSKISGTIGDGVSVLALDEKYERERAKLARNRPEHVGEGLAYGARDFGLGLFRGVTGVFVEPVRGAKEDGVRGFFTGISRGITGLYVKPAVGAVDMVTRAAEGMKNTTTYWEAKQRVRLPRFIGSEGVLEVFHAHRAQGQYILYSLKSGKYFEEHVFYKAHFTIGVKTVLLVTDVSLIQVHDDSEDWCIPLSTVEKIVVDPALYSEGLLVFFNVPKQEPRRICCVFNDQNFSQELLKLLEGVLRHEVDTQTIHGTPRAPSPSPVGNRRQSRRRSGTTVSKSLFDQLISDDESAATTAAFRVMADDEQSLESRGGFRSISQDEGFRSNSHNSNNE